MSPRAARGDRDKLRIAGKLSGLAVLILLLATVTVAAGGTIAVSLYRSAFEHHRNHLLALVHSQARLIAAVARFDARFSGADVPGGATAATLSQIRDAWREAADFDASSGFLIGRRAGDQIEFLASSGNALPSTLPVDSPNGEPMQLALQGGAGTVIGLDHAGREVLAAYEWVPELEVGVVAKTDLADVQAPLWRGVMLAAGFGAGVIALGSLLVLFTGNRLLRAVQAGEARAEEQTRLLSGLERTSDGVGLADPEGRITFVNRAGRELLAIDHDFDVTGISVFDVQDPDRAQEVLDLVARQGMWQGEMELRRLDGGRVPVSQSVTAHYNDKGSLSYFSTIVRDISAEREEARHAGRLATAIEQISEGIVITDAAGNIEYVNEALTRITGYERSELLGQNPRMLKSGHQDDAFYRDMWQTIRRGDVWRGQLVNKRKDGTFYEEEMTITPIRGPDGQVQSYVSAKRDITEQGLLESQLHQAQKMEAVGQLAGGVAHDFNNMLTGITGYAQLLLRSMESEADRSDLQQILELSTRAADLTQQLLAFSRRQQLEQRAVDLNVLIASTLKMLRRLIPEDIEVEFEGADRLQAVLADSGQMVQVIMNLAVNARDAMPSGGKLVLETDNVDLDGEYTGRHIGVAPGRYVILSMSDTGTGMDRETQKHIFEPFFTTKVAGKGTGLGLATVYGIVRQHGGYVNVYSEPGVGTAFKIYLPVTDATLEAAADDPAWQRKLPEIATVLLVEDEEAVREIIERTLGELGCHVLSAGRSSEARQLYDGAEQKIDLLLTDIVMPGGLGTELYGELRAVDPDLKVLFMSGYPDRGAAQLVDLPAGGAFLRKPFSPSTLSERVRQMLAQ
jgi:PAS domain S-box-containing protein